VVQGTRQVTEYVTRELTGLPHSAFVSTFFTKQKELSFFGDLGPTERREQVGKLLGLETIRVAQRAIGEQRTRKQAEARVKREQYEEQTKGIDFTGERARLDEVIAGLAGQHERARADVETCKQATAAASAARNLAQERYAADAELLQTLERINGDINRFTEIRSTAQRDLAAIADAELEIQRQQTQAANEPELRAVLERHEAEKKKVETVTRLRSELDRLLHDRRSIEAVLAAPVGVSSPGAASNIQDATSLIDVFDAEIKRLAAIDRPNASSSSTSNEPRRRHGWSRWSSLRPIWPARWRN
jgi:DNA repair exonuclease SbcCD ATPase subunit